MIDIHCHCLPGLDDGAQSLQESLQMLRMAVDDGIRHVIVTAHVHDGVYENPLSELLSPFHTLCTACRTADIPVKLSLGGEVHVSDLVVDLLESGQLPVLGRWEGRDAMLLELPHGSVPAGSMNLLRWLLARGIQPIIAHPERNRDIMRDLRHLHRLADTGCLLQVTAGSLYGRFGPHAEKTAWHAIEQGLVHFIASDAHNLMTRPPVMAMAKAVLRLRCGDQVASALTQLNAARLLGEQVCDAGIV